MKLASIERVAEVKKHPGADALDIVKVMGYNVITQIGLYKEGDLVVFIQPDTVLPPDALWAQSFLKRATPRVKAMKLRQLWSLGIIIPINEVFEDPNYAAFMARPENVGTDISTFIGVKKYEALVPQNLDAKGNLPFGLTKTDEDRYQIIHELPFGQVCNVTLKTDGQSSSFYCKKNPMTDEWETGVCSRSLEIKLESNNNYTRMEKKYEILRKLRDFCVRENRSLAVRGEIYGAGIQRHGNNPHAKLPVDFAMFSVFDFDQMRHTTIFEDCYFVNLAKKLNLPTVPVLKSGVVLTPELIKYYAEGTNKLDGKSFEGVVFNHATGSFKVLNLSYDEKK